jgi:hypothetical protein
MKKEFTYEIELPKITLSNSQKLTKREAIKRAILILLQEVDTDKLWGQSKNDFKVVKLDFYTDKQIEKYVKEDEFL